MGSFVLLETMPYKSAETRGANARCFPGRRAGMEDGEAEPGKDGDPARAVRAAQGLLGWAELSREKTAARLFCHVQGECGDRSGIFLTPRGRYLGKLFWHHPIEKALPGHLPA